MQTRKDDHGLHIILDDGEDERAVLRALIKAAYKCSYDDRGKSSQLAWDDINDAQADAYIGRKDYQGREHAVYAAGMEGATFKEFRDARFVMERFADRHFVIDLKAFESGIAHYHPIESLIGMAKGILGGTYGLFKTDDLDRRLAAYDLRRNDGEDDWDVRKRAFLQIWPTASVEALEFLYGCTHDKLSRTDKAEIQAFMSAGVASGPEALIASIPYDPLRRRGDQASFFSIFG